MPFFSVLRHFNHPSDASPTSPTSPDEASDPSSDNSDELSRRRRESEPTRPLPLPWSLRRKGASAISRAKSSPPIEPALVVTRKAKRPAPNPPVREIPVPIPPPAGPRAIVTDMTMAPPMEMITTTSPVPDLLAATWDQVKDGLPVKGDDVAHLPNAVGTNKIVLGKTYFHFYFQVTPLEL